MHIPPSFQIATSDIVFVFTTELSRILLDAVPYDRNGNYKERALRVFGEL